MHVSILGTPFDPYQAIGTYQLAAIAAGRCGACAHFVGILRGHGPFGAVQAMTFEHYPEMTQTCLQDLAQTAVREWGVADVLLLHRTGRVEPGEAIMVAACWSIHRKEAFQACSRLVEALKSTVPFWKKEHTDQGSHWVTGNTPL